MYVQGIIGCSMVEGAGDHPCGERTSSSLILLLVLKSKGRGAYVVVS